VGGGNVAMDSARTALRLGADKVYLIYRRSREEMPARIEEVHHAEQEGVIFKYLTNPIRYIGDAQGRVNGAECLRMELGEPDSSGRRKPVPVPGSEHVIDVDTVVVAVGNGPNPLLTKTTSGLETKKGGKLATKDGAGLTSIGGVWAGGDIIRGAATVILAMGDGKRAARAMDAYLKAQPNP
jgi:glutamate synthase (NADPH) small chain